MSILLNNARFISSSSTQLRALFSSSVFQALNQSFSALSSHHHPHHHSH